MNSIPQKKPVKMHKIKDKKIFESLFFIFIDASKKLT